MSRRVSELVQQYCRDASIPYSKIVGKLGGSAPASKSVEFNEENWVEMSDILNFVSRYRNIELIRCDVPVTERVEFGSFDSIFLVGLEGHCYVLAHVASEHLCYVANGGDTWLNDVPKQDDLIQTVGAPEGVRFEGMSFKGHNRVDHCGFSAVMICLEFLRCFKKQVWPKFLLCSRHLRSEVQRALHKHRSDSVHEQRSLSV